MDASRHPAERSLVQNYREAVSFNDAFSCGAQCRELQGMVRRFTEGPVAFFTTGKPPRQTAWPRGQFRGTGRLATLARAQLISTFPWVVRPPDSPDGRKPSLL